MAIEDNTANNNGPRIIMPGPNGTPIPQFDQRNPNAPGHVETLHGATANDQINFSTTNEDTTVNMNPANANVDAPQIHVINADGITSIGDDLIARNRQRASVTEARLRLLRLAGVTTGTATMAGTIAYGVLRTKALDAAAAVEAAPAMEMLVASAAPAEVVIISTEGGATVATSGGLFSGIRSAITAQRTLLGVSLPVWGWAAAAAAVAAIGYVGYKTVRQLRDNADLDKLVGQGASQQLKAQVDNIDSAAKPAKVDARVGGEPGSITFKQGARAFGMGFGRGAWDTAAIAGGVLVAGGLGGWVVGKSTALMGATYGPKIAMGVGVIGASGLWSIIAAKPAERKSVKTPGLFADINVGLRKQPAMAAA